MKFCPECGIKLEETPKFCPECGTKFGGIKKEETSHAIPAPEPARSELLPIPKPAASAYELGIRLEEVVELILKADGYDTQRRQRLPGVKGYHNEIDIVAIRGKDRVAVECKNFSQPVGISQVRDFAEKIIDLGPGWRGIFIGYNNFTQDASQFAESRNIEQLERDEVMEKWFALSVGRSGKQGEKITIEQALPINIDYLAAISLDLANKEKVAVSDVRLIYHPYIRYTYHFKRIFTDPVKEKHTFENRETVVIDLLDNTILNKKTVKNVEGFAQKLTDTFSSKGRQENGRRVALFHEVVDNIPKNEVTLSIGQDYRVNKLAVDYSKRDINRVALEYIIDENSKRITYSVQSKSGFPESRSIDFVPDRKDITIDNGEVVCVPKWEIHFNVQGTIYSREVLACSGKKLEDTIANCPHHFKLGFLEVPQKNYAVCEKCGTAFCKVHGRICEVCKIHLCENHAINCSSCKRAFCEDHISKKCEICGDFVCDDCIRTCPICGKKVGFDHLVKCDVCGNEVCSSCISVTGLIKKKRTCRKCQ